jgi:alkanesulfonate monooxygenase SsuD/methylene tetrahydromethanopterin reductase-like flavin-dependent oxidoreductase (luciferase family)
MRRQRQFGIQVIQNWTWAEICDRWKRYEAWGFESLWLTDHLTRTAAPGDPYLEAWTLLSALATQVERARIGVLVSSNTFRHPSVLAKQAVTVDHISNGRLEFGIGAGWYKPEHEMFGLDFPETGELVDRYAEALDLLDRFLRNDTTCFEGEYYTPARAGAANAVHGGRTRPPDDPAGGHLRRLVEYARHTCRGAGAQRPDG